MKTKTYRFELTGQFVCTLDGTLKVEARSYEEAARKAVKAWEEAEFDEESADFNCGLSGADFHSVTVAGDQEDVPFYWSSDSNGLDDDELEAVRAADRRADELGIGKPTLRQRQMQDRAAKKAHEAKKAKRAQGGV